MDEQYSLNWRDYLRHIKKSFDSLLRDNDFADVTLSCQGKTFKAHKMILSACSAYFHDLLRDNPCPHPIIILQGTEHEHIANILQFMYKGEVQVPSEGFKKFLKTAELLEISGLINESKTDDVVAATRDETSKVETEKSPLQRLRPGPASKKLEWLKRLEMKKALEETLVVGAKRPSDLDSDDERHKKKFVGNGEDDLKDLSSKTADESGSSIHKKLSSGESSGLGASDVRNNCAERKRSKPGPASKKLEWKKREEVKEWLSRTEKLLPLQTKSPVNDHRDDLKKGDVMEVNIAGVINPEDKDEEDDKGTETDNKRAIEAESEDNLNDDHLSNPGTALNDDYLNEKFNPNYECPVCGWKCVDMQKLKQHVRYHSRETKCRLCGKVFSRIELLHQHEMIVHEVF